MVGLPVSHDVIGPKTNKHNRDMANVDDILHMAGWFDDSPDGPPDVGNLMPIVPDIIMPGKEWVNVVQTQKKVVLDERSKSLAFKKHKTLSIQPNKVEIVDKSYLNKTFIASSVQNQQFIDETVKDFKLNKEQDRAFRIVANHASLENPEQLKMFLGGMAGTGKSQVIKALIEFFRRRGEPHRIIIVAPTGNAAAMLGGSTYHSVLGINDKCTLTESIAKVRTRLDGVDYIFFDEVSMFSCHDMYRFCAQLSKVFNEPNLPFGGINIIFAGDFAQLPPVGGGEAISLYSGSIGTQIYSGMTHYGQESAIGKALWHQITTVVILKQNMRQKKQSVDDSKFRTALENMRYKACTTEDIKFLQTRLTGPGPNRPKLAAKGFRNISIITSWNSQKDRINELGCVRFTKETGQCLVDFYSIDEWVVYEDIPEKGTGCRRKRRSKLTKDSYISLRDQEHLWNLPHHATDHFAGKLSICMGLPVMIRHNDATELCITKGQEGTVAGWQSYIGPHGKLVLDTLFVKLTNPPHTVNINGLPENVVPISKMSQTIDCHMKSDAIKKIKREQVCILPNFSMTDFASQGKTRPNNPVDLQHSNSHQSYYTCLSRSATAEGTLIIQSFNPSIITGGCSGWLRQEFRDLELLNEITELAFNSQLPQGIKGHRRSTLISQYRKWKGVMHVPENLHPAITWNDKNPNELKQDISYVAWQTIDRNKKTDEQVNVQTIEPPTNFIAAKGSRPLLNQQTRLKRKLSTVDLFQNNSKRQRTTCNIDEKIDIYIKKRKHEDDSNNHRKRQNTLCSDEDNTPPGTQWDGDNYSCAYDALFTILYNVWSCKPKKWKKTF